MGSPSRSCFLYHILHAATAKITCIGRSAHCVCIVRNARVFGAECCRWSVRDHARSRALFRPQTGRLRARTLGWNAETNFLRNRLWHQARSRSGNAAFSIIFCAVMKATPKNWNYVRENPVRAGLVTKADDWPIPGRSCSSIAHRCSRRPVADVSTAPLCETWA